ncbi:MAG: hypothetical protein QNJ98_08470 [Planctomycetota bacterium]|nr:hypothetical protein [Planctomycetota bacterium]
MRAACDDLEAVDLPEKDKVLYRYLKKVNRTPWECSQEDVDVVKAAGWSDAAIYDAITVCSIFNFFNRWIDATGVPDVPGNFYEQRLEASGDTGYRM